MHLEMNPYLKNLYKIEKNCYLKDNEKTNGSFTQDPWPDSQHGRDNLENHSKNPNGWVTNSHFGGFSKHDCKLKEVENKVK